MMKKNSYPGEIQLPEGGEKAVVKELRVYLKIYRGELHNNPQYVVEVTDINGVNPVYYKYADFMIDDCKKTAQIENDLMNRFGVARNRLRKIRDKAENLVQQNEYEKIDECKTRLFLGIDGNELEQEEALSRAVIDQHYNNVIDFIRNNIEFFPARNLSSDIKPDEGYIEKESLGTYIADEKGLDEYGEEVVAISRQCVQDLVTKNTTEFAKIMKRFIELGYFLDSTTHTGDLKQIKLRYKVPVKRMYLVRITDEIKRGIYHENM